MHNCCRGFWNLLLGIHLCGILSIRAVETFNRGPKCVGLVLKPCCLPSMEYAKSKTRWTLGAHSFAATEVSMWGKYNQNKWQGPRKATLESRFRVWADNLYRGVVAGAAEKRSERVPLVDGHYQDAYIFAERPYSAAAPAEAAPLSPAEQLSALVRQVNSASTACETLGVPEDVSMRALHRRWAGLNRTLSAALQEEDARSDDAAGAGLAASKLRRAEVEAAFLRVKVARDEIRAQRDGDPAPSATQSAA